MRRLGGSSVSFDPYAIYITYMEVSSADFVVTYSLYGIPKGEPYGGQGGALFFRALP